LNYISNKNYEFEEASPALAEQMASAKENYRVELRAAARQLGDRCLYSAAKWYAAPRNTV
jgi:hypothetical protein